jgi:hypothetical protein
VCFPQGIKIYDLTNPAAPVLIGDTDDAAELSGMNAYDIIPLTGGNLLVIGSDGFFQLHYNSGTNKLELVSKIPVNKEK